MYVSLYLCCHLLGVAISRSAEQPRPAQDAPRGAGGGSYLTIDAERWKLLRGWQAIDETS